MAHLAARRLDFDDVAFRRVRTETGFRTLPRRTSLRNRRGDVPRGVQISVAVTMNRFVVVVVDAEKQIRQKSTFVRKPRCGSVGSGQIVIHQPL